MIDAAQNIWVVRANTCHMKARHDLRMAREWRRRYRLALQARSVNFALLAYNARLRHIETCKELLAEARALLAYAASHAE